MPTNHCVVLCLYCGTTTEQLQAETRELRDENQRLKDENNRPKGEQSKPEVKAKGPKESNKNYSSETERKAPKKQIKSSKNALLKVDREKIIKYPQAELPFDSEFKGDQEVIVQDILLQTDNVLFQKQKYYSPSQGKTYLASLPSGYDGEFGPGVKDASDRPVLWRQHDSRKALRFFQQYGDFNVSRLFIKSASKNQLKF